MEELKACPFCGSQLEIGRVHVFQEPAVSCSGCSLIIHQRDAIRRTPPPHTAAMLAWAKRRIADIKALQAAEMAGWNEREERERLEAFVGEWES